jgi:hypothetical protein
MKNMNDKNSSAKKNFIEIRVKGQLDNSWSEWLESLEIKQLDNGEMILSGHITDQAALMGILNRLYGLNLPLLSVNEINQTNNNKEK